MTGFVTDGGGDAGGLVSLALPRDVSWTRGLADFLSFYDWDRLLVVSNLTIPTFTLCSGYLPCRLSILEVPSEAHVVTRDEAEPIACLSSLGCAELILSGVQLDCGNGQWAAPLLRAQGSILLVINSSFSGCSSVVDGAVLQAYDGAVVRVRGSRFLHCRSQGYGGCVASLRSDLEIIDSSFENCAAELGGGSVWVGARPINFDKRPSENLLSISFSTFLNCSSAGRGGAILAAMAGESVSLRISDANFTSCHAGADGGALSAFGAGVVMYIMHSQFSACSALASGGAVSAASAELGLFAVVMDSNAAWGLGGGAIHLFGARFFHLQSTYVNNSAPTGGGGVLLWRGNVAPAKSLAATCPSGMAFVVLQCTGDVGATACQFSTCGVCPPGTWLADGMAASLCWLCPPGSYSAGHGSSVCTSCAVGRFSSQAAATHPGGCNMCSAGSFASAAGSSLCLPCMSGSFSSSEESSTCDVCPAGQYATTFGAVLDECVDCEAGLFSFSGASDCLLCAAGTFATVKASSTCFVCGAGTFSSSPMATSSDACAPCFAGSFSFVAASECSTCSSGSYSTALAATTCIGCPSGSFANRDLSSTSTNCTLCLPGWFTEYEYSSWCVECTVGGYNTAPGSKKCMNCPLGAYIDFNGATACLLCPAGTFSDWLGSDGCQSCAAGSYASGYGSSACEQCQVGHFSSIASATADWCQSCPSGSFTSAPGASGCNLCDLGHYANQSEASLCAECPAGHLASSFNLEDRSSCMVEHEYAVCKPCYPGFYSSSLGASMCTACALGTFSRAAGQSDCTSCWNEYLPPHAESDTVLHCSLKSEPNILSRPVMFRDEAPMDRLVERNQTVVYPSNDQPDHTLRFNSQYLPFANAFADKIVSTLWTPLLSDPLFKPFVPSSISRTLEFTSEPWPQLQRARRSSGVQAGYSTNLAAQACGGVQNWAVYGPCLASTSVSLELTVVYPQPTNRTYVGLPLSLEVLAKDAHGQRVVSDFNSFFTCQIGLGLELRVDETLSAAGDNVFQLAAGRASPVLTVRPSFAVAGGGTGRVVALRDEVYVAVSGSDALTGQNLASAACPIHFATGFSVCPPGFVLRLDAAVARAPGRAGGCVACALGSYSVDPLASPALDAAEPACFNCPASATCPGGAVVEFKIGSWVVSQGMFVLIECPRGNQLVNSVGGVFSHDVQQCVACQPGEYILASNSSFFACQPCPVGARCDGSGLTAVVNGSAWVPDTTRGIFVLTSCPSGYELLNRLSNGDFSPVNQECRACPASFFCVGGTAARSSCPEGTYSPPGANSSRSCEVTVFVLVVVSFEQLAREIFDEAKQAGFRKAIALATGLDSARVVITGVAQARRGAILLLRVDARVATKDTSVAAAAAVLLKQAPIDRFLDAEGLPGGRLVSVGVSGSSAQRDGGGMEWVIGGAVAGGCVLVAALVSTAAWWSMRREESQDQRRLRVQMEALRIRLGITRRDGYLLSTESLTSTRWFCSGGVREVVIVPRAYLEAAARLGLWLEFDVAHLDALCLCLEHLDSHARFNGVIPPAYLALCDWMLEVSKALIRPSLPVAVGDAPRKEAAEKGDKVAEAQGMVCSLPLVERFPYFSKRVCKARIWASDGGALFNRLKAAAKVFMDDIADLCDRRFEQLRAEEGGESLITFFTSLDEQEQLVKIRRQDHPEVRAVVIHDEAVREASALRLTLAGCSTIQDEEVFIAQLLIRARLLNADFQKSVQNVVARHAIHKPSGPAPSMTDSTSVGLSPSLGSNNPEAVVHALQPPLLHSRFADQDQVPSPRATSSSSAPAAHRNNFDGATAPAACPSGTGIAATADFKESDLNMNLKASTARTLSGAVSVSVDLAFATNAAPAAAAAPAPPVAEPVAASSSTAATGYGYPINAQDPFNSRWLAGFAAPFQSGRAAYARTSEKRRATFSGAESRTRGLSLAGVSPAFSSTMRAMVGNVPVATPSTTAVSQTDRKRVRTHGLDVSGGIPLLTQLAVSVPEQGGTSIARLELRCAFSHGAGNVEVSGAPIKAIGRMREKLSEYAREGATWPLAAQILDPVRASVVCESPAHMLEVASWFLQPPSPSSIYQQRPLSVPFTVSAVSSSNDSATAWVESEPQSVMLLGDDRREAWGEVAQGHVGAAARSASAERGFAHGPVVCRVKNKFALDKEDLVGSYRDLMLCAVVEGAGGLRIIGEIQIHDKALHDLKMLMHKLYRVRRAKKATSI